MRKLFKFVLIAGVVVLGLFAVLLAAAAIIIPRKFPPEKIKSIAVENLSKALNRNVSIKAVKFELLKGFQITDLRIPNRDQWTSGNFVSAKEISVSYHLLPLLWGEVSLGEIKLNEPKILIENKGAAGFNFSDMAKKSPAAKASASEEKGGKLPFSLTVGSINILHGKVDYLESDGSKTEKTNLGDVNLKIKNISMDGGKTTLSLGTPFTFQKMAYQLRLDGACRYDMSAQTLKDLVVKGDVSGVGFEFSGSAKNVADNFSPDIKGSASLEMIKTIGLLPRSLASMPDGLELKGPAVVNFQLGGNLNGGLSLDAKAEGEGMYVRYKDLFLKESKMPMRVEFKSVKGRDYFKIPSYHAVFRDWEADGSFSYKNGDSYSFALKTKSMPIAGISETVPKWKAIRFSGNIGIDAVGGQKLGNDKSFQMKGKFDFKDVAVSHPKEPKFLEGLTTSVDLTESILRIPDVKFRLLGTSASMSLLMTRFHLLELGDVAKLNASIVGHLNTENDLDLERFMTVFSDDKKEKGEDGKAAAPEKKKEAAAKDAKVTVGPGMTADWKMNFKSFTYRKLKFKNVTVATTLAKQTAKNQASVSGFGGTGSMAVNVGLSGVPSYNFNIGLRRVAAEQAVNDMVDSMDNKDWQKMKDKYFGMMDFDFKGTALGTTKATLDKSLAGSGACTMTGAMLKGYSAIKAVNGIFGEKSDEIKFDVINAKLSVKDTVLSFTAATIGKVGHMRVAGGLSILDWVYKPDMKVECDIKKEFVDSQEIQKLLGGKDVSLAMDAKGNVPVDFKFTGKASENHWAYEPGRLLQNVGKNLGKKVVEGLGDLFKKKPAPAPAAAPAQPAAPAAPAQPAAQTTPAPASPKPQTDKEKAENALKSLFGK